MSDPMAFGWLGVESWVEFWWVVVGLGGQILFTARFLVQWLASERVGRSMGLFIYIRNLVLIHGERRRRPE